MTIGFLINTCEPFYRGGYERRTWSFARELARQGHDVRIYTSCPQEETIEGVEFVPLARPRRYFNQRGVRNGWADLLFTVCVFKLLWKLRGGELDVLDVCATPFLHLPVAGLVSRWKRIPLVVTCHEALLASLPAYVAERGQHDALLAPITTKSLAAIYRLGMSRSSRRIAVSRRTAAALALEKFPAEAVVEFGLEPEAFGAGPIEPSRGEPVRFVFCGRLTPIKAVGDTVEALLSLRNEGIDFRFDIIGEGSEQRRLMARVQAARAEAQFIFHGELSEEAKRAVLARAEVFVLSSAREGFSIATLEAMAQGCGAVVVSDPARPNGALDFVQDGVEGLCVAPGPSHLRDALRKLLHDRNLRWDLRQAAWRKAGQYRIENQAARLADCYGSLNQRR